MCGPQRGAITGAILYEGWAGSAHGVPGSSMVTVMSRNGVNFGLRLSGTDDQWFQAPANPVDGLYFPGYSVEDAAPTSGTQRSPRPTASGVRDGRLPGHCAVRRRHARGRDRQQPPDAQHHAGREPGVHPARAELRRHAGGHRALLVADSGVRPIINTGIAHKQAGIGQIGAGITSAPMPCFTEAIAALAAALPTGKDGAP
jgi:Protein of unknown function (DUF1116)